MKILISIFSLWCFLILSPSVSLSQVKSPVVQNFDSDWKFRLDHTIDASSKEFNDSGWESIQLPHDWSITLPLVEPGASKKNLASMGFMPGGTGWYRKSFSIAGNNGKNVFIRFDGVYHQCEVYINGKRLGFHPYGYTGFEYDLTPYLNTGNNSLAVKVDHSDYPSSRWYSGSGIYRHVWLIFKNDIYIPSLGTCIATSEVKKENATIKIVSRINNSSEKNRSVKVRNRIIDQKGNEIAASLNTLNVENGKSGTIEQSFSLKEPRLWSVGSPYMYKMETTLLVNGKITDRNITPFGIRYFRFDADKGFFLNGENIKLKGVNLHQDAGSMGTAIPDMVWLRRLKILKEYGCNAIRCSHNPPAPEFLDICDSLGFIVIDEAFDKWRSGYYAKYFDEWWKADIDAMVLRDRNHPSVFLWSIGNETNEQNQENGATTARMLQDYIHSLDPTRPVTAAISPSNIITRIYNENGFTETLDIVGLNYQEPWLVPDKKRFPGRIMYIAEAFPYYTGRSNSLRDYNPRNPWYDIQNNDFAFGQFIWAGIDYLGESSGWPSTGWPTGLFDICMFEKPRAAFHRSVWNNEPMVRIVVADQSLNIDPGKDHWSWPHLADHWNFPQYRGHIIEVQTITNCDSVELYVNSMTLGKRSRDEYPNNTIVWHVPYHEGKIEARGYNRGKMTAKYELNTSGKPARIDLKADRYSISDNSEDVAHITIKVVDDKGIIVPDTDMKFTVEVTGSGKLRGLDNGDLRREGSYAGTSIRSYFGKALAVVQSSGKRGNITVKVTSPDLPESEIIISAGNK